MVASLATHVHLTVVCAHSVLALTYYMAVLGAWQMDHRIQKRRRIANPLIAAGELALVLIAAFMVVLGTMFDADDKPKGPGRGAPGRRRHRQARPEIPLWQRSLQVLDL